MSKWNIKTSNTTSRALILSTAAAVIAAGGNIQAQDQTAPDQPLQDKVKQLETRLAELENKGPTVAAEKGKPWDAWLGANKFSGFISSSFLYNFNGGKNFGPEPGVPNRGDIDVNGRAFDDKQTQFMLNKLKLTLEKPVNFSATNWDVGYRADLIVGQDAQFTQPLNGPTLGDAADYEQIYVTANIPVGRGLQVSVGRMVTLLGVEVIEETANPNWSVGNQFTFVENATSTGLQLSYKWTDTIDTQVRVNNGWDVVHDNNDSLSYMGRIGFTPNDQTGFALLGYGGPEEPGNSAAWREGVELIINHKITPKLTGWVQADYGHEAANSALPDPTHAADWWAAGLWMTYDFTEKIGLALRGDYLNDQDGARTSGARGFPAFPTPSGELGQRLYSLTATLNTKPYAGFQVRPEVRWDHSDLGTGPFGSDSGPTGRKNQVTVLLGVAYVF